MAGSADGFTAREAARITGLTAGRVRALLRDGVLPSGDATHLRFNDLVFLRQVKRLLDAGVPLKRIRSAYDSLGRENEVQNRVQLSAESGSILAANGGVQWEVGSGQLVMQWAPPRAAAARGVSPLRQRQQGPKLTADQWYELGIDLESSSLSSAIEAYRHAVTQDPEFVEAHINLGRLLHVTGSLQEAKTHYEKALRLDPLDPIPAFNLGVVLEDLGLGEDSLRFYRLALRRDPDFADAHYNLALVYERKGHPVQALKHARRYRELTGSNTGKTR